MVSARHSAPRCLAAAGGRGIDAMPCALEGLTATGRGPICLMLILPAFRGCGFGRSPEWRGLSSAGPVVPDTRVAVFIDYQNCYMGVREAMGWRRAPFTVGQVYPRRLAILLSDRGRSVDPSRRVEAVRVFRGEPSAAHSPKGQAACQRQVRYWGAQANVIPVTRPLKYYEVTAPGGKVVWEPREKGIDVLIALQMVMGAHNDDYDVAILVSADTDLVPAVETVLELGKRCEVAAWQSRITHRSRLSVPGQNVWCHWLDEHDYRLVEDPTDYTRPQPGEPSANP